MDYASVHGFPPVGSVGRGVRGISETEKALTRVPERTYIVVRYTRPHGYAVIEDSANLVPVIGWHVHPEALERA